MKTIIAAAMMLSLVMMSGCRTAQSQRGGAVSMEKGFTIIIPKNLSLRQGTTETVMVELERDDYFKQDVQMEIVAEGIDVMPNSMLLKASELPELALRIAVASDAALGKYRVKVRAAPATGTPTETTFTVEVVKP